jgi:hypothetical protein
LAAATILVFVALAMAILVIAMAVVDFIGSARSVELRAGGLSITADR